MVYLNNHLSLALSFSIYLSILVVPLGAKAAEPIVYVNPPSKTGLSVDETFPVNVTVADVSLLFAWEFQIYYKSGVLNASDWTPGPVFTPPLTMIFNRSWTDNYNATHGLVHIVCTYVGQRTFNGTGTLATIYFKVKSTGATALHLENTLLFDNTSPFPQEIPNSTSDGMVVAGGTTVIVGDVNSDGSVDIYDAIILSGAYNSVPSDPNWNPKADINGDNTVDIYDAIVLAGNFGEKA